MYTKRRKRHIISQMKFFGGERFKRQTAENEWKLATKPRDGWGKILK